MAIARRVPQSFPQALTQYAEQTSADQISLPVAREQLDLYLTSLRQHVPTLCLSALDDLPDSVFVEDTVIAIGKKAVITNPGHPSRRPEVDTIKQVLLQLGMTVHDMRKEYSGNSSILCDGGDVMYTGRHLFVGLSGRTNQAAVDMLSNVFGIPAIPISFPDKALHLKSIVTHLDETTLLAPTGRVGDAVLDAMQNAMSDNDEASLSYQVIRLPNMLACNVVSVNLSNGTRAILAQDGGCLKSRNILQAAGDERDDIQVQFLEFSEFAKCDGALTCCSVLLEV